MVDRIEEMVEGTRLFLLAPIVRGRKGEYRREFAELQKKGFTRIRVDGEMYDIEDAPTLDKNFKHDIEVVVDRIVVRPDLGNRVADLLRTALALTDGLAIAENADDGGRTLFSAKFACPCPASPSTRSNPVVLVQQSARRLPGLRRSGHQNVFRPALVVPDPKNP